MNYILRDVRSFVEDLSEKRVLIFPPFNNFRRFLIHQIVETHFGDLKTFSIGEGDERRTVVCFRKDYKPELASDAVANTPRIVPRQTPADDSGLDSGKRVKRARTMPSVSIYRPPAARKLEQHANLQHSGDVMGTSGQENGKAKPPESPKEISQTGRRSESDGMSVFRNAITSIRTQNKVPKCKNGESGSRKVETEPKVTKPEEGAKVASQSRQRRPDMQVYVPKGRRSTGVGSESKKSVSPVREEKPYKDDEVQKNGSQVECIALKKTGTGANDKESLLDAPERKTCSEVSELKVTQENAKNESLQQQTNQKVIICSDSNKKTETNPGKSRLCGDKANESKNAKIKATPLNPEEDDWEAMYDDTGECLDPSLLDQLTSAVGEVTLEKPKSSYNGYKTKSLDTVADEFPHVIEIYNFPPEFQLQDLMMVFSQFKNSGFEIKWVDDTHALGIFSSSAIVSEVLDFYHPFVKTRSLKDGTVLSKMKARRSAEFLQPYKPRPETCSALARRLVTGALGVRLPTSRQEREAEKQILKKARERKKLEAKQKEDAWEGTFTS